MQWDSSLPDLLTLIIVVHHETVLCALKSWFCSGQKKRIKGTHAKLLVWRPLHFCKLVVHIMIGLKRFSLQGLVRQHRVLSTAKEAIVPSFKGRATVNGTFDFVRKSALPLYHQFATSKLTISPIIHGPPSLHTTAERNKPYIEALTRRAVVVNRSNCIVVYQHYPEDEPYYATNLATLFTDPANDVRRDQVVIVANIGLATTRSDVYKRLSNACQKTGMEMIDMVMFEVRISSLLL